MIPVSNEITIAKIRVLESSLASSKTGKEVGGLSARIAREERYAKGNAAAPANAESNKLSVNS